MSTAEVLTKPESIQSYGAVIAHYFSDEQQIKYLVVERDPITSKHNGGKLQNVMGGAEEFDYDHEATVLREADEEISRKIEIISGRTYEHEHLITDPNDEKYGASYMAKFFLAHLVDEEEIELNHESSRQLWLAEEELDGYVFAPGSKEAIQALAKYARIHFGRKQTSKPIEMLDLTTPNEVIIQLHGQE